MADQQTASSSSDLLKKAESTRKKARSKINKIRADIRKSGLKKVDGKLATVLQEAIDHEKETRKYIALLKKGMVKKKDDAPKIMKAIVDVEKVQKSVLNLTDQIDKQEEIVFSKQMYQLHLKQLESDARNHYAESGEEDVNGQVDRLNSTIEKNDTELEKESTLLEKMRSKLASESTILENFNRTQQSTAPSSAG